MGFRENYNNGTTYWLQINGFGNLYESSREPKEGFVAHTNQMTGQFSGYWREHPSGIVGYLNYIGIKTSTNQQGVPVQYLIIAFKDYEANENFCVKIPVFTQKGGINRYVKSFVKYFQNIDYSRPLVFNSFKRKAEDQFSPSELIIAYPGEDGKDTMVERYFKTGQNGWPSGEKYIGIGGKESTSYQVQDNFAYNKLNEYIGIFNNNIGNIRNAIASKYGIPVQSAPVAPAPQQNAPVAPHASAQPAYQVPAQPVQPPYQASPTQPYQSVQPAGPSYSGSVPPQQGQSFPGQGHAGNINQPNPYTVPPQAFDFPTPGEADDLPF